MEVRNNQQNGKEYRIIDIIAVTNYCTYVQKQYNGTMFK